MCLDQPLRLDSLYRFRIPSCFGHSNPSISASASKSRAWSSVHSVGGFLCSQDVPTPRSGWWRQKAGPPRINPQLDWESSLSSDSESDHVLHRDRASFGASSIDASTSISDMSMWTMPSNRRLLGHVIGSGDVFDTCSSRSLSFLWPYPFHKSPKWVWDFFIYSALVLLPL